MNVSDVIHGRMSSADLRRTDGGRFPNLPAKSEVLFVEGPAGDTTLEVDGDRYEVEGVSGADLSCLRELTRRALPMVAWLVQASQERALVQFHEFSQSLNLPDAMEIGVDDRVVDDLRRRLRRQVSTAGAVEWMREHMLLPARKPGTSPRALLSGAPLAAGQRTAFRLYGNGFAIDVQRAANDRLGVTRIVESRRRMEGDDSRPILLVIGDIRFADASVAAEFRGVAQTVLDEIVDQADSYLGLWQKYNDQEQQVILQKARDFGWVKYAGRKLQPDGAWCFDVRTGDRGSDELWRRLDALDEQLEAGVEVPSAIQGDDAAERGSDRVRPFVGELSSRLYNPPRLSILSPADQDAREPPEEGYLFVALGGDEVRVRRRSEAWEKVRSTANPMPQLGLILENRTVPERRQRPLKPMTRSVREVFDNPNDWQRHALDVALNTPDIALIQGPPGTGKTRVIAALQARLAEQDEDVGASGLAGNTLLTSFQHDAVANAAAATRVMGLPAVKIGYRRGSAESLDGVTAWATETAQAVRAARGAAMSEHSVHVALRDVRELAVACMQAPAKWETPATVIRQVQEIASPWLPGELADELAQLRTALSAPAAPQLGDEDRTAAVKAVRGLRTDATAFGDDGPRAAYMALRRLRRLDGFQLASGEADVLDRAVSWDPGDAPAEGLLAEVQTVRDVLLDRLQPADAVSSGLGHADAEDMIVRVIDALAERAKQTAPGVDLAIDEWLATLEQDPDSTRDALRHYTMVLAATCQQAVSRPMAEAKHGTDTVFRTVVVDEAARANPLDLLIPMSLAERRIILVGDHRQLPHLLEPNIERELEQDTKQATRDALRLSLFEKLFTELRKREKGDGVIRTVTLNQQYRMHPLLGSFVSQQFYEPHGEGFESARNEDEFAHDVSLGNGPSLEGKVGAWLDVPLAEGAESGGRSKRRQAEANRVAKEAHRVVTQHSGLSVGVITFYAGQRDEILSSMLDVGLTAHDDEGVHIRDDWLRTTDGRERLRVGTVDSFQGKEFDIVFLSLTRSNNVRGENDAASRRRYGFLMLENRLCVAMSRQQRLLVIVGDAAMAKGAAAESAVPALVAFRELCEGPHGSVVRP